MANSRKKISELPALSVASLDTTFVLGISGSTTYKISINNLTSSLDTTFATDLVTNALSSSLSGKLSTSSFNSYTSSFTASVASGTISGSSQLTSSFDTRYTLSGSIPNIPTGSFATTGSNTFNGNQIISGGLKIVNSLNPGEGYGLQVNSILPVEPSGAIVLYGVNKRILLAPGSAIDGDNREEHFVRIAGNLEFINNGNNSFGKIITTGSITALGGITGSIAATNNVVSGSQQIANLGFVTGSYTTINSFNSLTQSFNSISQSFNVISGSVGTVDFNGVVSGSSQLTSSYDTRYTLSGSVQPLPSNLLSSSAQITAFGFISSSTTIDTGSLVTTSSFNSYTASLNTFSSSLSVTANSSTKILDAYYTSAAAWSGSYSGNGGTVKVEANFALWSTSIGSKTFTLFRNGVAVDSGSFYFNNTGVHTTMPTLYYIGTNETGTNTYSVGHNAVSDNQDSCNIVVTETFNTLNAGLISGSSQLTSSYDTRYVISGSVGATPSGTISGSAQITAFGFVSGSYETTGRGIISSSANLVATSSFNSYTASISTASLVTSISNLNSFTASQSTASLVTSISNLNSTTSSLNISVNALNTATSSYETKGRGLVSGSSQITYASISSIPAGIVSGSSQTIANLPTGVVSGSAQTILNLPTGVVSGSSQLTSSYDGRYTQTGSFNTYTSSINSWTSSFSSSLTSSITSVSGTFTNLTVNGQPTTYGVVNPDFINAGRITSDQTGLGANSDIIFNAWVYKNGVSLDTTTGVFTLTANKTYRLFGSVGFVNFSSATGWFIYEWVDATTNTALDTSGISVGVAEALNRDVSEFNATSANLIYTPSTNQTIKLRITNGNGTTTIRSAIGTKAIIEQINPTIAVQATATGTVAATIVTDTNVVGTTINGGSNTSPALTILTLAIPSAGTWRLDSELRVYVPGAGYMAAAFYDNGTLIPGSEYFVAAGGVTQSGAATGQYGGFMSYNLTTTSARTVTVGIWSTTSAYAIDSGDGRTWARATKIDSTFALNTLDTMQISSSLAVSGSTTLKGTVNVGTGSGLEGGEIDLAYAQTTTLTGSAVVFDVYADKIRIFENGGNSRGVSIDLSKAPNGVGGDLMWKASGFVNRGIDVTLGNLKVRMAATGNASLQVSTVTGTYSVYGSDIYSQTGTIAGSTIDASTPRAISTTPAHIAAGYNFTAAGATDTWILMDTTVGIAWRITMIVGSGYNNNLITIERLY